MLVSNVSASYSPAVVTRQVFFDPQKDLDVGGVVPYASNSSIAPVVSGNRTWVSPVMVHGCNHSSIEADLSMAGEVTG